ncbi:MAG: hypothetical protein IJF71_01130, partial [Clostridia bacterium]|nr:hypothetical protein [Clostridia bacterium]
PTTVRKAEEPMYHALILLSVAMFGGGFALNEQYRRKRGDSLSVSLEFSAIGATAGFFILLAANRFRIECTPFTLVMALLSTLLGIGYTFFSFKAFQYVNLSLYSLFSMLGGMALPFLQGILFYNEGITVAKALCFAFILAALLLTVERGKGKTGIGYCLGVFVLNGMSGVLSKLFTSLPYEKASATGYSLMIAICTAILSLVLLFVLLAARRRSGEERGSAAIGKPTAVCAAVGAANGVINRVANLLLVIALAHVQASVQYPMVTGGVIIVSTAIAFFGKSKPSKRELCSVVLAFAGLMILFLLPF